MSVIVAVVMLIIHLLICIVLWLLARVGILRIKGYFFPVIVLVPVWGVICVLILQLSRIVSRGKLLDSTLERLRINEETHKSIHTEADDEADLVVPLEEALLVDAPKQKRKLIMSVLTGDSAGYYNLLQQARLNDDSEVVHYASTALAQISKEADLKLQKLEQKYAAVPDDPYVLEEYCNYLEEYIESGFAEGKAAEIQRNQLEQLLRKRIGDGRDFPLECKLASVQIDLRKFDSAEKTLDKMNAHWPQRETPCLLRLRMAAVLNDGAAIKKTLENITEKEVYLSSKGRETVRYWSGEEA